LLGSADQNDVVDRGLEHLHELVVCTASARPIA
jgi:hypothetical protein